MLKRENTLLLVVDVQGRLANLMHGRQALFDNLRKTIQGMQVLGVPILWVEQNPQGLGPTVPEVADVLTGIEPMAKNSFSCWRNERVAEALKAAGRKQVLLVGIEAHVCIYQTAMDLMPAGYEAHIVTDAVSSRTQENRQLGLETMKDNGAHLTGTEMALFELLGAAEGPAFKELLKIVK